MEDLDPEIAAYIKKHEGCRLALYQDTEGYPTIGYGHLCVHTEYTMIDQEKAEELFAKDYAEAKHRLCQILPEICDYSGPRKMALLDMSFQLGGNLTHFPKALAHVKAGEWALAVADFLDSLWARNQSPRRAIDNAILLIKG
jgi:GH24 family phage-related lysozyme (muramidase)